LVKTTETTEEKRKRKRKGKRKRREREREESPIEEECLILVLFCIRKWVCCQSYGN